MSSLTAKYRPRRFAEVAGQDAVKAILSRASATGKIAPAYMFSGTRGVGKTTIARIFAKALNCEKAPAAEPCNECRLCRQANAGSAVDIIEIDAASHGGVGDVRALKEDVGYAPLEGRFKVFIIDEAHMLSTAAFNALLKTLEEPPARVTFILASTEAHKFPATILSRCQHYVFKMLPQAELAAHLEKILQAEGLQYEAGAVRIIARRGAGSVRDSISLLGQALAYSAGTLVESEVRACLGLAGQEVFFALMEAIAGRDLPLLSRTLRGVLDQGLDLGFFLRELSGCWRNMFLLRQAGEAIVPELGLPAEEAAQWTEWAGRFSPAHIHACWQMTLDGQQRVIKSLEPAQALELLLLNLACLPDLLPLSALGGSSSQGAAPRPVTGGGSAPRTPSTQPPPAAPPKASPVQASEPAPKPPVEARPAPAPDLAAQAAPEAPVAGQGRVAEPEPVSRPVAAAPQPAPHASESSASYAGGGGRNWEGFLEFVAGKNGNGFVTGLSQARGEFCGGVLTLSCHNETHSGMMDKGDNYLRLQRLVMEYFGPESSVAFNCLDREPVKSEGIIQREMQEHPVVQRVRETFECRDPALVYPRGR
ncbi:MAG: DNA polymerase III subunit gamma/tau [Humidesulfovibrio sp.]|jgi:DNA polymerase-3 subunit gamma/tau|uniref:DNA polymerase III subunit gamma/tau n=1 Tax=Humidesulfovibrio sp. TaxID=2910988 RepID=UPI0027345EFA|nr:DNA polymerase III subunit gamma/tau [Humidesulfovibrio sp.]MDP2848149.1 DNA polymerase III subunit gamma/tau [Humidesulfovibrio sp.]